MSFTHDSPITSAACLLLLQQQQRPCIFINVLFLYHNPIKSVLHIKSTGVMAV